MRRKNVGKNDGTSFCRILMRNLEGADGRIVHTCSATSKTGGRTGLGILSLVYAEPEAAEEAAEQWIGGMSAVVTSE